MTRHRNGKDAGDDLRKSLDSLEETTREAGERVRKGTGELHRIATKVAGESGAPEAPAEP